MRAGKHVLQNAHFPKNPDVLKRARQTKARAPIAWQLIERYAREPDLPGSLPRKPRYDVESGGLARTIWADQAMNRAARYLKRHIRQRLHRPKANAQIVDFQQSLAHLAAPIRRMCHANRPRGMKITTLTIINPFNTS